jgi:hypothetical protein
MSISDEEFQRFQNQLVELKTRNYQLEEQNKRLNSGKFRFLFIKSFVFCYFRKWSIKNST